MFRKELVMVLQDTSRTVGTGSLTVSFGIGSAHELGHSRT